jgi:hypothetical protein
MALITPNFNPSTALATPGFPMVEVSKSNPLAEMPSAVNPPAPQLPAGQSVRRDAALAQVGHQSDRVV